HKTEEEATKLDREARDRDAIMLKMQENITDKEKEAKRLKEQVMAQEREKAEAEEIVKESETVILSLFRDIESYKSQFNSLLKAIENRNSDIDSALKLKKKLEGELIVLTHKLERTRSNVQKVQEERMQITAETHELEQNAILLDSQLKRLMEEKEKVDAAIAETLESTKAVEEQIVADIRHLSSTHKKLEQLQRENTLIESQRLKTEEEIATISSESSFLHREASSSRQDISSARKDIDSIGASLISAENEFEKAKLDKIRYEGNISTLLKSLEIRRELGRLIVSTNKLLPFFRIRQRRKLIASINSSITDLGDEIARKTREDSRELEEKRLESERLVSCIKDKEKERDDLEKSLIDEEKRIQEFEHVISITKEMMEVADPKHGQADIKKMQKEVHIMEMKLREIKKYQKAQWKQIEQGMAKKLASEKKRDAMEKKKRDKALSDELGQIKRGAVVPRPARTYSSSSSSSSSRSSLGSRSSSTARMTVAETKKAISNFTSDIHKAKKTLYSEEQKKGDIIDSLKDIDAEIDELTEMNGKLRSDEERLREETERKKLVKELTGLWSTALVCIVNKLENLKRTREEKEDDEEEDEEKEDEELVAIVKDIDSDGTEIIKKLSGIAESLHTKNLSEQLSR
ncbi:Coiled-coil domain-containing protein 40 like protein, partial [Aduncisulcus paluster]